MHHWIISVAGFSRLKTTVEVGLHCFHWFEDSPINPWAVASAQKRVLQEKRAANEEEALIAGRHFIALLLYFLSNCHLNNNKSIS